MADPIAKSYLIWLKFCTRGEVAYYESEFKIWKFNMADQNTKNSLI